MHQRLIATGSDGFDRFWESYPRRVAKKDAKKAWDALSPSPELIEAILSALSWQRQQPAWLKHGGQYIPHPGVWIRNERWTDEPFHAPKPKTWKEKLMEQWEAEGKL